MLIIINTLSSDSQAVRKFFRFFFADPARRASVVQEEYALDNDVFLYAARLRF